MDILIVGCGVSGLTTGVRLLEAGHRVAIVARELPPHTTSNAAAAVWEPFEAYPADRVAAWAAVAYRQFLALANEPRAGVIVADALEVLPAPAPHPAWAHDVDDFRDAEPRELPAGAAAGIAYRAPVIDTSRYLTYLVDRLRSLGGRIQQRPLADLAEAFALSADDLGIEDPARWQTALVVNCAGLGARELAHDAQVSAARGQVVRVAQSGFHRVLVQNTTGRPTYIVPRIDDVVLGGTFEVGAEDTTPDPTTRADILRRCAELALCADPRFAMSLAALAGGAFATEFAARLAPAYAETPPAIIREEVVGLRPISPRVRVESQPYPDGRTVVHNYGHGGAGVTLSWGCAAEVADLVQLLSPVSAP
jgi:D-amino-acid oxidase